jgi:hypothetical protein
VDEPTTRRLGYATPPTVGDLSISRDSSGIRFDLGPLPTSLFVAKLVSWVVCLGLLLGVALSLEHPWRGAMGVGGLSLTAIISIVALARYRHLPRVVGVADGQLFYSDQRTRGVPMGIRPYEVTALIVYRSWWRPWIFELTTVPPAKYMGISATNPVVLLIGLDWRFLDRVRWELSTALGLEGAEQTGEPAAARRSGTS